MLAQIEWILPPRQVMQVKYSRFVNVHGRQGCNIPCDLHMEHLNRIVKICIKCLGANKTEASIQRVGKCITLINEIIESFD
jgi:L1 cell adhesion molecule like protein